MVTINTGRLGCIIGGVRKWNVESLLCVVQTKQGYKLRQWHTAPLQLRVGLCRRSQYAKWRAPGTQMKNIVGHCEYSLMTHRRSRLSHYTRNISHTTICAIVNCWFGLLFDLLYIYILIVEFNITCSRSLKIVDFFLILRAFGIYFIKIPDHS